MESFGTKISCDACFNDISQVVRINCASCLPETVDLCVSCFARGSEVKDHVKDHNYIVVKPLNFSVSHPEWTAYEDLLLLDGLERKGLGNWGDVSRFISSGKTAKECEAHYTDLYLNSPMFPLPAVENNTGEGKVSLSPASSCCSVASPSQPSNHEIYGFMPKRNDFETEYENEFENIIKDMQFNETEDSPKEIELKLALLKHYCIVLDKREERKEFAFDRELTQFKRMQSIERVRGKTEKEILASTKHFARFLSPSDYEAFVEGLILESTLKDRITILQCKRKESFCQATGKDLQSIGDTSNASSTHNNLTLDPGPSSSSNSKRKMGIPIDLTGAEGVELLLPSEVELCSILRLLPKIYLSIKETLLKEYARTGVLKRAVARSIVKIDVNKTGRIYDFFVAAGWVKPRRN